MTIAGSHRDRGYTRWWIVLGVVFFVAIALIYLGPFTSAQPEQALNSTPDSITEAPQPVDNDTGEQGQSVEGTKNVSIAEDSPSRGAEQAAPEPSQ